MPFRTFQSRVILSFLLLITLVQVGALIAARKERLVEAARILSANFPFKQVVALGDRDTLRSAIDNHRARIGADLMMVLSLDGTRIVDSLQRDAVASHASPAALSRLVAAARQAGELVLAPENLDLNTVVTRVTPMLRRLIGEDVELVTVPASTPARVVADPAQMTQILTAERPETQVLYISGYVPDAIVHHGVLGDRDAFVSKPIAADALLRTVRARLSGPRRA